MAQSVGKSLDLFFTLPEEGWLRQECPLAHSGCYRLSLYEPGQIVSEGQEIFVIEAMKMQNIIKSQVEGKIRGICELIEGFGLLGLYETLCDLVLPLSPIL